MNVLINSINTVADTSSGTWSKLTQKLDKAGTATKDLVGICQDYWYIPMFFALIIIAILVFAGGREGRVQAKSKLGYFLIGTAIVMLMPSIVSLIGDIIGHDDASAWSWNPS